MACRDKQLGSLDQQKLQQLAVHDGYMSLVDANLYRHPALVKKARAAAEGAIAAAKAAVDFANQLQSAQSGGDDAGLVDTARQLAELACAAATDAARGAVELADACFDVDAAVKVAANAAAAASHAIPRYVQHAGGISSLQAQHALISAYRLLLLTLLNDPADLRHPGTAYHDMQQEGPAAEWAFMHKTYSWHARLRRLLRNIKNPKRGCFMHAQASLQELLGHAATALPWLRKAWSAGQEEAEALQRDLLADAQQPQPDSLEAAEAKAEALRQLYMSFKMQALLALPPEYFKAKADAAVIPWWGLAQGKATLAAWEEKRKRLARDAAAAAAKLARNSDFKQSPSSTPTASRPVPSSRDSPDVDSSSSPYPTWGQYSDGKVKGWRLLAALRDTVTNLPQRTRNKQHGSPTAGSEANSSPNISPRQLFDKSNASLPSSTTTSQRDTAVVHCSPKQHCSSSTMGKACPPAANTREQKHGSVPPLPLCRHPSGVSRLGSRNSSPSPTHSSETAASDKSPGNSPMQHALEVCGRKLSSSHRKGSWADMLPSSSGTASSSTAAANSRAAGLPAQTPQSSNSPCHVQGTGVMCSGASTSGTNAVAQLSVLGTGPEVDIAAGATAGADTTISFCVSPTDRFPGRSSVSASRLGLRSLQSSASDMGSQLQEQLASAGHVGREGWGLFGRAAAAQNRRSISFTKAAGGGVDGGIPRTISMQPISRPQQ